MPFTCTCICNMGLWIYHLFPTKLHFHSHIVVMIDARRNIQWSNRVHPVTTEYVLNLNIPWFSSLSISFSPAPCILYWSIDHKVYEVQSWLTNKMYVRMQSTWNELLPQHKRMLGRNGVGDQWFNLVPRAMWDIHLKHILTQIWQNLVCP